jgi:hypothetical protein
MASRVPTIVGHVDPTAERQGVIDDDHLLVMAGVDRVVAVEPEVNPPMPDELERQERQDLARQRCHNGTVPLQKIDPQLGSLGGARLEECAELVGRRRLAVGLELDPQVELPADQHHRVPCPRDRGLGGGEIVRCVDDRRARSASSSGRVAG